MRSTPAFNVTLPSSLFRGSDADHVPVRSHQRAIDGQIVLTSGPRECVDQRRDDARVVAESLRARDDDFWPRLTDVVVQVRAVRLLPDSPGSAGVRRQRRRRRCL